MPDWQGREGMPDWQGREGMPLRGRVGPPIAPCFRMDLNNIQRFPSESQRRPLSFLRTNPPAPLPFLTLFLQYTNARSAARFRTCVSPDPSPDRCEIVGHPPRGAHFSNSRTKNWHLDERRLWLKRKNTQPRPERSVLYFKCKKALKSIEYAHLLEFTRILSALIQLSRLNLLLGANFSVLMQ